MPADVDRDRSYAQMFRDGRGADFEKLLVKSVGGGEVEVVQSWLDSKNAYFFRAIDTAFQNAAEKDFEQRIKNNRSSDTEIVPKPVIAPTNKKRRAAFDSSENVFWQRASYDQTGEKLFDRSTEALFSHTKLPEKDVVITKTETDNGVQIKGSAENTKIVGDVTITQGATGDTRTIMVSGGDVGTEYKGIEYVEVANKKERTSTRTETTVGWRVLTASCPDADGISAGTGTTTNAVKITITNPQTIGILTRDITIRMTLRGVVNDAAELTHFDLEGTVTETTSGYARAERLGLIENSQYADGTKQVSYQIKNNKPGTPVENEYGFTKTVGKKMGDVKATIPPGVTEAEARRIDKIASYGIVWIYEQAGMYYKAAENHWRYYGCVEIALTAPKTKLLPAERIDVSAETVHKHDKSKVNAELTLKAATDSATPEKENGTPQVKFTLTAPPKGANAMIIVESVSRRGIALEILNFEEEKPEKNPVKTKKTPVKKCDGAWSGKITAVKSKRTELSKPADGRLVREIENKEETFSIDYHVTGIPDTSQGFTNAFYSDAQLNYRAVSYREQTYAAGKMSCGGGGIISTTETRKFESLMTALSSKKITVFITVGRGIGILTFDSPEINAERIITRTYETSCPSYDQKNSGVDRGDNLIGVPSPGFEVEFDLLTDSATELNGNKTIQNSDGSETLITWSLTRGCK